MSGRGGKDAGLPKSAFCCRPVSYFTLPQYATISH
jgi:hypothetical protein